MSKSIQCIIIDDEVIAREILENHLGKIEKIKVVSSCKNAIEAYNALENHNIDLIFLDINMPEISGLTFAKSIPKHIKIIFTTAYREYAIEGFDLQAVDYLLKPVSFDRLYQAIHKFYNETRLKKVAQNTTLEEKQTLMFVRADRKMIKINFNEIQYIESTGDYIKIVTENGNVVTRETISNIEAKLPTINFLRTHRSYIISLTHVVSFTNEHIDLKKKAIPISRSYKSSVLNKLESL